MRRFLSYVVAGLGVCAAGCGTRAGTETAIDFWALGSEVEQVQPLFAEFERENPGLKVRIQQIPWTAAHEKLLTAFAGDATPDVCQLGNTWIPEFASLGALAPLDERVAASKVVDPSDYFPGVWETNRVEPHLYGIPWYADTRLMYYRTDLLKAAGWSQPPKTWDDWLAAMRKIKEIGGPDRYAILIPINEWEQPTIFGLQTGSEMLKDDGRFGNFESPEFRRAFEFYVRLFDEQLAPTSSNTQISNVWDEFGRGFYAMYISGPWNIAQFQSRLPPELQDKWATAPLPSPDPNTPSVSQAGGCGLVIFNRSKHKDEAWRLIEFLSRPENLTRLYEGTGNLPPRESSWKQGALANDARERAFHEQLEHAKPLPRVPEWEQITTKIMQAGQLAIAKRATVDEALASLDRAVDTILEKRRWMLARQDARWNGSMTRNTSAFWSVGHLFVAPAIVILLLFFFLPILFSFVLSVTDFDIYALANSGNARFVGLDNYRRLLHEPVFWQALGNTVLFVAVGGPLTVLVSLTAAIGVNSKLARCKTLFRTIYFAPVVTTLVAVAVVWRYLYHTRYGLFNYLLSLIGISPIDWLGNPRWAMLAIIFLAVWKNFGYNMVIFIAGLQSIPEEMYEAARIDGAGTWRTLWHIKLPLLAPTFLFVGVTTMIGYFQLFAEPYVMTQGGPLKSTYSVVMYMYEEGFRWWNIGFASSVAFVLFLIILLATFVQMRLQRKVYV